MGQKIQWKYYNNYVIWNIDLGIHKPSDHCQFILMDYIIKQTLSMRIKSKHVLFVIYLMILDLVQNIYSEY